MQHTLFLASTPLHVFLSLGLMHGPFRDGAHTLALIDQKPDASDYIADALEETGSESLSVVRFPVLGGRTSARRVLARISEFAAEVAPTTIAVGNDRRIEFYAAIRGCPSARRTYVDDGLYSYLPHRNRIPPWRQRLSNWRRGLKYGVPLERPSAVGASRAVEDAFVLLPEAVHPGLAAKPVQRLRPEWFADAWVRRTCEAAAARAGFEGSRCRHVRLLLLLPHPHFLQADPELRRRMEVLARSYIERGEAVALKAHPAVRQPAHLQLGLAAGKVIEIPARLPVEVLAPLLSGPLVVGTLTTALLSLALLGDRVSVRSLPSRSKAGAASLYDSKAQQIYESVGIRPLDPSGGDTGHATIVRSGA